MSYEYEIDLSDALEGEELLNRLLGGKAEWNKWAKTTKRKHINFSSLNQDHINHLFNNPNFSNEWNFKDFIFPKGNISFRKFNFQNRPVCFDNADFGIGDVDFRNSTFHRPLSFGGTRFGRGRKLFDRIKLHPNGINLNGTHFGSGLLSFKQTSFTRGNIDFSKATFSSGKKDFSFTSLEPNAVLIFDGVDFNEGALNFTSSNYENGHFTFKNITKGKGNTYFEKVRLRTSENCFNTIDFGDGSVYFDYAEFGTGNVDFNGCSFRGKKLSFANASKKKGYFYFFSNELNLNLIDFSGFKFDEGDVVFTHNDFGKADVNFESAESISGTFDFTHTKFNGDSLRFNNVKFPNCNFYFFDSKIYSITCDFSDATISSANQENKVLFWKTEFVCSEINFKNTNFGKSEVDFSLTIYDADTINFNDIKIDQGRFYFNEAVLGSGEFTFEKIDFPDHVDFSDLQDVSRTRVLSFKKSSFEKSFVISSEQEFGCVVDFRSTRTNNHIELHSLRCKLNTQSLGHHHKSRDMEDLSRLTRLKEIAEDNKHHEAAIRFHADELRAKRWGYANKPEALKFGNEYGLLATWLDITFETFCDYGKSVARPFCWWVFNFTLFSFAFGVLSDSNFHLLKVLGLSLLNSVPFFVGVKSTYTGLVNDLFYSDIITWAHIFSVTEGIFSFIFLFLIGLGLRNRFRI